MGTISISAPPGDCHYNYTCWSCPMLVAAHGHQSHQQFIFYLNRAEDIGKCRHPVAASAVDRQCKIDPTFAKADVEMTF